MRGPATAMLWTLWRLTRLRLLCLAVIGLGISGIVLVLAGDQRETAQPLVVLFAAMLAATWSSGAPLLCKSGFPFAIDFTRPIPTWLLAGLPLLYMGVVAVGIYAAPLLVLENLFDVSFPLLSGAAYLSALTLLIMATRWWTRSRAVRLTGQIGLPLLLVVLLRSYLGDEGLRWGAWFAFELRDYAPALLASGFAFGLTVLGVERQRRGDDLPKGPAGWSASPLGRLVELRRDGWGTLVRAPCPATSATRAELWLELKYRGAPVLAVGAMLALAIPLAFWALRSAHPLLPLVTALGAISVPLLVGVNASISRRGGAWHLPMSPFEAVRPLGTARLAGLQVLVTSAAAFAAGALIGVSIVLSLPLFEDVQLARLWREAAAELAPVAPGRFAANAALTVAGAVTVVAWLLVFRRLAERFGKRFGLACFAVGVYLLLLVLAQALGSIGWPVIEAHLWAVAGLAPLGIALVFPRVLRERLLTWRQVAAFLVICAGIALLYLESLQNSGILLSEMPAVLAALLLSSSLLPLAAVALAPWSLALVRHV